MLRRLNFSLKPMNGCRRGDEMEATTEKAKCHRNAENKGTDLTGGVAVTSIESSMNLYLLNGDHDPNMQHHDIVNRPQEERQAQC
jgi:hypothetical protein